MRPHAGATLAKRGVNPLINPCRPSILAVSPKILKVDLLEAAADACRLVLTTSKGFVRVAAT